MNEPTNDPDDVCGGPDDREPTSEMHAAFFEDGGCAIEATGPGLDISIDLDGPLVRSIGRLATELGPQLAALFGQASGPPGGGYGLPGGIGQAVIYTDAGDVGEPSVGPRWHYDQFGFFDEFEQPVVLAPIEIENARNLFAAQRFAGSSPDEAAALVCEWLRVSRSQPGIRYVWLNSAVVSSVLAVDDIDGTRAVAVGPQG